MLDRFDNDWLCHVYASEELDGRDKDRRVARICSTINYTANNVARRQGVNIPDSSYRDVDSFLGKRTKRVQTWEEMRSNLMGMF